MINVNEMKCEKGRAHIGTAPDWVLDNLFLHFLQMGLTHEHLCHKENDSRQDKGSSMENGYEGKRRIRIKSIFNQRITLSEFNAKKGFE